MIIVLGIFWFTLSLISFVLSFNFFSALFLVLGLLVLCLNYRTCKIDKFYNELLDCYILKVQAENYLTKDIKIEIKQYLINNNKDISSISIQGSLKDDDTKNVFLRISLKNYESIAETQYMRTLLKLKN